MVTRVGRSPAAAFLLIGAAGVSFAAVEGPNMVDHFSERQRVSKLEASACADSNLFGAPRIQMHLEGLGDPQCAPDSPYATGMARQAGQVRTFKR